MLEQVEMVHDSIREYKRIPRPANIDDDLDAAAFLTNELHAKATGLVVLSKHLLQESASLLAHLNSIKYLGARKPSLKNKGYLTATWSLNNWPTVIQPQ
jgi:hypothetical protein